MPINPNNPIYVNKSYSESPVAQTHYTHTNNGHEIYLLLKGDISFSIDGQIYKLEPYDLLIISDKEVHRTIINSNTPYERIYLYFNPEFMRKFDSLKFNLLQIFEKRKHGFGNKIDSELVYKNNIADDFNQIYQWYVSGLPEKNIMMISILMQLIVKITNAYYYTEEQTKVKDDANYNGKIYDILNYITINTDKKITLDELEKIFFINKYYLCHLFKKSTGYTVHEYISLKKIFLAKELLKKNHSINYVCNHLGYDDYSNFYRIFKKITGVSPSAFIKQPSIANFPDINL